MTSRERLELAAQNQQLREALETCSGGIFRENGFEVYRKDYDSNLVELALSAPDLASPVLNRVRAEALRYAADEFDAQGEWKGHGQQLRNMADAIEKGENGDSWIV